MTRLLLLLLASASPAAFASAVDAGLSAQSISDTVAAVVLVGGAVMGVNVLLTAYKRVRMALGVGGDGREFVGFHDASRDDLALAGFSSSSSDYLSDLASRLAAEDAAQGIEFRDVETGKTNLDYMRESGLAGEEIDRSQHSSFELDAYDYGAESAALRREREEIFLSPLDHAPVPFAYDDTGTYSTAQFDAFLAGSSGASFDSSAAGPDEKAAFEHGVSEAREASSWQQGGAAPVFEFEVTEDDLKPVAVDHGSALLDFVSGEAAWAAGARVQAQEAGADMALYDRFIAEEGTTHEEAMRWAVEAGSGVIRMPVIPPSAALVDPFTAGLNGGPVDSSGWGPEENMAYDAGRDAAHEAYLQSIGTSSAENRARRGKD